MHLDEILTSNNVVSTINEHYDELLSEAPEIGSMRNFDLRDANHQYDLWNHTLLTLYRAEEKNFSSLDVRMALLLHDIGKTTCYYDTPYRRHYPNYSRHSMKAAYNILLRLKYDDEFIKNVLYLVGQQDMTISETDIETNSSLAEKLFQVQYCDTLAHNFRYINEKRKYLKDTEYKMLRRRLVR